MSKGVKTMMGKPAETADLNYWELTGKQGNLHRTALGLLNAGVSGWLEQFVGPLIVGPGAIPNE